MTERTVRAVLEAARDSQIPVAFPPSPRWFRVTAVRDCTPTTCQREQCEAVVDLYSDLRQRALTGVHIAGSDVVTVIDNRAAVAA